MRAVELTMFVGMWVLAVRAFVALEVHEPTWAVHEWRERVLDYVPIVGDVASRQPKG